jgi:hypothetical protein
MKQLLFSVGTCGGIYTWQKKGTISTTAFETHPKIGGRRGRNRKIPGEMVPSNT